MDVDVDVMIKHTYINLKVRNNNQYIFRNGKSYMIMCVFKKSTNFKLKDNFLLRNCFDLMIDPSFSQ